MNTIEGNTHFRDHLSCGSFGMPIETILDSHVAPAAGIQATKLQHQHVIQYSQAVVSDTVTTETKVLHICRGVGIVVSVEVVSAVCPSADTDYFTVDVQRVRAGSANSVLTAIITYNNTNAPANWTILEGTISGTYDDLQDGDMLEVIVTAYNNGGTNASGCCVNVVIREAA